MTAWTDDQRDEALAAYDRVGPRAASRETGIPVATIGSWAAETGRTFTSERTRRATEARRARVIEKLHAIAELGADIELELLGGGDVPLRDVVGARTRAIHDLQLLSGEPTTRADVSGLTADERRGRLAELIDELEQRRGRHAS